MTGHLGTEFPHLMAPGHIGKMELKNRVIMAPIGSLNGNEIGQVSARTISYYRDKAAGGTGLIIVEATYIDDILSKGEDGQLGLANNSQTTGMALLANCIHDYVGTKVAVQLCHIGQQLSLADRMESLGPSDMTDMSTGRPQPIRGMTRDEMAQLVRDFATAAWRAKVAGMDAVEIHGANGHLLNMFMTPYFNHRQDEYGGSIENRMRLMVEIVQAVRQACGPDYPILVRITGDDFDPDGITLEDGVAGAKILEEAGVDAIDVVGGSNRNGKAVNVMYNPRGAFVHIAEAIKKAGVKVPITVAGGITTPEFAEQILAEGKSDFISLARPLLADSAWVKKIQEGRREDIVPCIRCCMSCVGTMQDYNASKGLFCSVNPRCNMYEYRNVAPAAQVKKRVAIVGAGPAGMEAARLATLRGHKVTLFERRSLGGAMHEANFDPELKSDIQNMIDYYELQMQKLGIPVVHKTATAQDILDGGFDAAIVATGALNKTSKAPGADKPHVYSDFAVTSGAAGDLGESVVVVGAGSIGAEIAVSQAMKGKKVTLTTRRGARMGVYEIAADDSSPGQMMLIALLKQYGVDVRLCMNLKEVVDDGIVSVDAEGNEQHIPADSVVLCVGYKPNDSLYEELRGKVPELYKIGDCVRPRMIGDAILEGWQVANQL